MDQSASVLGTLVDTTYVNRRQRSHLPITKFTPLRKYDLFEHVVELEAYAMTVVPPVENGIAGHLERRDRHASELRSNPGLRVTLIQNYLRSVCVCHTTTKTPPQLQRIIGQALYPYEDSQNPARDRIAPLHADQHRLVRMIYRFL